MGFLLKSRVSEIRVKRIHGVCTWKILSTYLQNRRLSLDLMPLNRDYSVRNLWGFDIVVSTLKNLICCSFLHAQIQNITTQTIFHNTESTVFAFTFPCDLFPSIIRFPMNWDTHSDLKVYNSIKNCDIKTFFAVYIKVA